MEDKIVMLAELAKCQLSITVFQVEFQMKWSKLKTIIAHAD